MTEAAINTTTEPEIVRNQKGKLVFQAPAGAHANHISNKRKGFVTICRAFKLVALGYLIKEAVSLDAVSAIPKVMSYGSFSLTAAALLEDAKQTANESYSIFKTQAAKTSLAKEFLRELNPIKGFKEVIQQRDIGQLSL